jgi:predicted transcriptional regulator
MGTRHIPEHKRSLKKGPRGEANSSTTPAVVEIAEKIAEKTVETPVIITPPVVEEVVEEKPVVEEKAVVADVQKDFRKKKP